LEEKSFFITLKNRTMNPINWYYMWTSGGISTSLTINLDSSKTYLVTGGFVQSDGGDYSHAFISEVCTGGGDTVNCGVRTIGGDTDLNLYEFISGALNITLTLRSNDGRHRIEGSVFEL
jgi:hypothetical protein